MALVTIDNLKHYVARLCGNRVPIMTINHTLERKLVEQIRELSCQGRISIASDTVFYIYGN